MEEGVWSWRPSASFWFQRLQSDLRSFNFDSRLLLDCSRIRKAVIKAAENNESWLVHPVVSLVASGEQEIAPTLDRHFLLATWFAAHLPTDIGYIDAPRPLWLWTSDGGRLVPPGRHDLAALGAEIRSAEKPVSIDLDLWGITLGTSLGDTWILDEMTDAQHNHVSQDIISYLTSLTLLETQLADLSSWASTVTKVVIPFCFETPLPYFRSSSSPSLPGMIRMDISCGHLRIIEALVHESAHRYLYLYEMEQPLVDPRYSEHRYPSPLKSNPRPLRAVVLAYHALAYICAAFHELACRGFVQSRDDFDVDLEKLRASTSQAGKTCEESRSHLTEAGNAFLENTRKVVKYACAE